MTEQLTKGPAHGEIGIGLAGLVEDGMVRMAESEPVVVGKKCVEVSCRDGFTYRVSNAGEVVRIGRSEERGNGCLVKVRGTDSDGWGVLFFPFRSHDEGIVRVDRKAVPSFLTEPFGFGDGDADEKPICSP